MASNVLTYVTSLFMIVSVYGFTSNGSNVITNGRHQWQTTKSTTSLNADLPAFLAGNPDVAIPAAMEGARREFFLWFVGASGGAGIARSQFPKMYENTRITSSLKGVGPTAGGDMIPLNPFCFYPSDISKEDYKKIVNNRKSVEQIVDSGPKDSYLAELGYLTYPAFVAGNPGCNPLALRAIFDTFATGTNNVEPNVAQKAIDSFKADPSGATFANMLLVSKLRGFSAIFALLFLLGLADVIAFDAAYRGWFPEWPGKDNLPLGLINPGLWTIPQYWI